MQTISRPESEAGALFFLRLPESGLEMGLPLIAKFPSSPKLGSGLVPDLPGVRSMKGIAENTDLELAAIETNRTKLSLREGLAGNPY